MTTPPTGTVTFLFTDIAGSTQRWEQDRAAMASALARHNAILDRAIASNAGHVFKTVGDAYCATFADAASALAAAVDAQRALHAALWDEIVPGFEPLRVRMGIHTGLVDWHDGDYFGRPVNRVARLMAAGHGGQVLVSLATQQLVRDALPAGRTLVDLGVHRLRDLEHTEHVFRLVADGYPDIDTPPDTAEKLPAGDRVAVEGADVDAACPYRGLHAFRESDAPYFFGREAFTDLLVDAVATAPMVGVIGPSGSGKSSVVYAGLVPRLRAGGNNGRAAPPWRVLEMRPGARPYHALAGALLPLYERADLTETDRLTEIGKLAGVLRDGTVSPADVLARIANKHPDLGRLLLVTDQFEELYTLCPDEDEHRAFQDLLFAAAFNGNSGPPVTLALTLRADFMGHALAYRPFADAMQHHNVILGPMNREELARAIRLPAEAQGRAFESGLVERIVDDVGEKAGTLPLLEFALTKLWDEQHAGWLTHEAYEAIGRVEGAVARHADAVYAGLAESDRDPARRVFVQLVQPGEGTEDTRRLATKGELGADWELARKLADARLVTTGRDDAGHETAEVVHEALIRSWERLREWINADRRFRTWQERLRIALRQWEAVGDDDGTLLRGAPLAEAEGWLSERRADLTEAERRFVEAGVELRDREVRERQAQLEREAASARKLRRRALLLSFALIAAGVLAVAALALGQAARASAGRADQERDRALARELAGASLANRNVDPELSVLLALRAISVSQLAGGVPVPEPERALHLALQHARRRMTLMAHEGGVNDVAVSPDGLRVATCGKDGIKLWDLATGRTVLTITQAITTVTTVAFSPDGAVLASGGPDRVVRLWDSVTGTSVRQLTGHTDAVTKVAFSPDGLRLVSASNDKTAIVWDVHTGDVRRALTGHTGVVYSVAWSPDGARVATGSGDKTALLWDANTGARVMSIFPYGSTPLFNWPVFCVAFSPDGMRLATVGGDARIWNSTTGELIQTVDAHEDQLAEAVFSSDGKLLLTASSDKTAHVSGGTGVLVEQSWGFPLEGHRGEVGDVAMTSDRRQAITGSSDGTVGVWNITGAESWRTIHSPDPYGYVIAAAYSPDGLSMAAAEFEVGVRVWDLATGTAAVTLTDAITDVQRVAYSADGRTIATGSKNGAVRLWQAESGQLLSGLVGHSGAIKGIGFSPDGTRIATSSSDQTVRVWNAKSGVMLLTLSGHKDLVNHVDFSPDGSRLVTGSEDETARVWDVAAGNMLLTLSGHTGNVQRVSYSPDGSMIATASDEDRTVKVWDATSGRERFSIISHVRPVSGIDFSSDSSQLATASWEGTVKVWDAKTGEEVLSVAESAGALYGLEYSPDGHHLAARSVMPYGNVYIFTLRLNDLVTRAHERVKRALTEEECRKYLHVETCRPDASKPADR
ncbi:MAG: hypothetical protein IT332_04995 [Ardenticatenales bacterium]|nr:hypothetical protein [Ardenticatenales bacterium]